MPQNRVSISEMMEQSLHKRRSDLEAKLVELQQGLDDLAHDEKDPLGNSGLQSAQNDIAYIHGRITEIDEVLNTTDVITDDPSCCTVNIGKRVVLRTHNCVKDHDDYDEYEVVIDGVKGFTGIDDGVVTPESPIGKAIIGAAADEERVFVSPKGKMKIVIISVTSR